MTTWKIKPCTVADGAALAHNMSAFWEDPNWRFCWPKHITLEFLIEQSSKGNLETCFVTAKRHSIRKL